jgi:hypothetical protein
MSTASDESEPMVTRTLIKISNTILFQECLRKIQRSSYIRAIIGPLSLPEAFSRHGGLRSAAGYCKVDRDNHFERIEIPRSLWMGTYGIGSLHGGIHFFSAGESGPVDHQRRGRSKAHPGQRTAPILRRIRYAQGSKVSYHHEHRT